MDSAKAGALLAAGLACLLCAPAVNAAPRDKDAFASSAERVSLSAGERRALRDVAKPGTDVQLERRLGVPTTLWAADPRPVNGTPTEAARRQLERLARYYDLAAADVDSARVTDVHDTGRGGIVVTLRQYVDGVPVFREEANLLMSRDLGLVGIGGYLSPSDAGKPSFPMGEREAVALAASDVLGEDVRAGELEPAGSKGTYELFNGAELQEPARAERVMYRVPERLEPAYYVEVNTRKGDEHFGYVVGARDGRILSRQDLVSHADFSYRVWADATAPNLPLDGPQGNVGSPHPTGLPDSFEPAFAAPSLVTLTHGPISTNDPWLADGATETAGNNADAYADLASPDGLTPATADTRATTTASHAFDRTYDTSAEPQANGTQTQASITQAFYTVNILHDWFYDSGFDEESGIAQADNYGRGGAAGDRMRVEAQDHAGLNNANMFTPADGTSPRMQLFLHSGPVSRSLTVNAPASLPDDFPVSSANFGPTEFDATDDLALADDGTAPSTTDGCQAITGVSGAFAVIDRGNCTIKSKTKNAQDAGATGVLIVNNAAGGPPGIGNDAAITTPITIPTLGVSQSDGATIKTEMASQTVNVTMSRSEDVDRDSALDNQIVAHEWGHYISTRLAGPLGTNMARGLGEGWSDFHALLMTVRAEDAASNFGGVYPYAPYAARGLASNAYYFGFRRVPYSTDFTKNALTFRHISDGEPLPAVPTNGGAGPINSAVHNTGEVWATMLWEAYAELLRDTQGASPRLTFAQAEQRMRDYLVVAYKMTPADPTLLEARDALLMAADANDGQDAAVFWEAFARRGAGSGAVAPDRNSTTNTPVVESFEARGMPEFISAALVDDERSCDSGDGLLDNGERGRLRITVRNEGAVTLDATTATIASTNANVAIDDSTIEFADIPPFQTREASAVVTLAGAADVQQLDFDISIDDPDMGPGGPVTAEHLAIGAGRVALGSSASDDVLNPVSAWSTTEGGQPPWTRELSPDPLNALWHGPDAGSTSDTSLTSPPLEAGSGPVSFSFLHRYSFETSTGQNFDGGVIEYSTDGGTSWSDITTLDSDVGYDGPVHSGTGNPLSGRQAYGDASTGYPAFATETVDLGSGLAGTTFLVRFRVGTDAGVGAPGWDVDDVSFTGLANTPFHRLVADSGCPPDPVPDPPGTSASEAGLPGPGVLESGTQPGAGLITPADTLSPTVGSTSVTNRSFAVDRRGAAETLVPAAAKKGTTFRFSVSEDARVLFTIERATVGRTVGRNCRRQTRSNRKRRKCTLYVSPQRFAVQAPAGGNRKNFSGRIGRRSLSPGQYRATLVATDAAGNSSTARRVNFKVVRR